MSIVYRNDSDGIRHQIWAQQQNASCAVAAIWMARNQAFGKSFAEDEWDLAWRLYSQVVQKDTYYVTKPAPASLLPTAYGNDQSTFGNMFANHGTFMEQVAEAIKSDGLAVDHLTSRSIGTAVDASRLADNKPAIILLGWYNGGVRDGGHFIVASRRTKSGLIVYLDPWEGKLSELGTNPFYQVTGRFEQILYLSVGNIWKNASK